jgi:hypothetical protein
MTESQPATVVHNTGAQWQFMVFDAATPEACEALTNINVGALPASLLVMVSWSQPDLVTR